MTGFIVQVETKCLYCGEVYKAQREVERNIIEKHNCEKEPEKETFDQLVARLHLGR